MQNTGHDISAAAESALVALKWASVDYLLEVEGVDINDLEWSEEAQKQMAGDIDAIMETIAEELADEENEWADILKTITPEHFGGDFVFTRNHHGVGFWDRGYGSFGEYLTNLSNPYGETNVFVTENGELDFE